MSRFMVQTVRFRFLVVALLVIGAAEPGALAQGGGGSTGGGTVYFINGAHPTLSANYTWSMDSDGSNVTQLGWWGYFCVPSRDLHNGYRWYLTTRTIPGEFYPDGTTPRSEVFAYREDYDLNNNNSIDTKVQLTDNRMLQPFLPWLYKYLQWLPGDQTISFMARKWDGSEPVDGGLYTADLVFLADGNIIGLAAQPASPTLDFPLDGNGMPIVGMHSWDDTGTRVVYNDQVSTGSTGLWVADLSFGTRTQIFWGMARDPDWSPDGTKIAFGGQGINTIKPNGKGLKSVIRSTYLGPVWCDSFGKPYFSPTGSHIVVVGTAEYNGARTNDVFRATASGRSLTNLTETWDINEIPIGWRGGSPPPPPPGGVTVSEISPNWVNVGTTGYTVIITGSGFVDGAIVTFENGKGAQPIAGNVVFDSSTQITAEVTVGTNGPPRNRVWDVRVTNLDASTGTLADGFTVIR